MANGIFLIGAIEAFPFIDDLFGSILAIVLLLAWILIYRALFAQVFNREFFRPFLKHPLNSFMMGTWVAGLSVLCNVFVKYFPGSIEVLQWVAVFNCLLLLFFLVNCFHSLIRLMAEQTKFAVHGIILLSTVGTQSIVILLNNTFDGIHQYLAETIIVIGLMFYFAGIFLLIKRYLWQKNWSLIHDWANTNCIIHGALSITGLAIVKTEVFEAGFVFTFWFVVFILLITIEFMESVRAVRRVKLLGWKEGLFTYNVSQWSRNFTFGMFYAFSYFMQENPFYAQEDPIYSFHAGVLTVWGWIVLLALLAQLVLYATAKLPQIAGVSRENYTNSSSHS
ncbi:hypothetical protein [Thalassobacillus pellis]|uniref:SLAC1 family transporter n=1 Tax=Thalassobacillus pellis TaxID=748008 RepID=UPI001961D596|nr:hypothetical protein [Thalassobacillus pellis]MBM7553644.1 hypothetical protein [Thalassobacillus pellis]